MQLPPSIQPPASSITTLAQNKRTRQWICCQIGAREHYAVPRALDQGERLNTLYTDFWAGPTVRTSAKVLNFRGLRSFAARYHLGLAEAAVTSWNTRALFWEARLRGSPWSRSPWSSSPMVRSPLVSSPVVRSPVVPSSVVHGPYTGFIDVGRRFAIRVREALKRRTDLGPQSVFFAYDTGALEAMEWCRSQGVRCVLNQMDPNRVEVEMVREEEKRWPGWALETIQVPEEYFARREREWALADRIVVNSEFSRQALLQQGVPESKLAVIPLCYEAEIGERRVKIGDGMGNAESSSSIFHLPSTNTLRVLFLGQVILRKGIQYLLAAARQLERQDIHFDVVGPIGISREAVATAPGNVTFHGRAGRDEAAAWYQRSDLFVLPTLSDGFAITQLEAMAHGLPVIATTCCGDVVTNGVDGFVVPPRDPNALAMALQRYLSAPDLLPQHQKAALEKSTQFTLARLAGNLRGLEMGE